MRIPLFVLVLSTTPSGCVSLAAAPTATPDFHSYVHPDEFCYDAGLGIAAIGYREGELPWVDEMFCVSGEGLHIVSATKNGGDVHVRTMHTPTSASQIGQHVAWVPPRRGGMSRISLEDGLIDGCPGNVKPLAIMATDSQIGSGGAYIRHGILLCGEHGDLVVYNGDIELERWTKFTPIQ